jgi:fermentation-respiration switch protein FrsA (DUF1100 family)
MMKRGWHYWLKLVLFGINLISIAALSVVVWFTYQGSMNYVHPHRKLAPEGETPASLGVSYEDVVLVTVDGVQLQAWYTPSQNGAVILVGHGYKGRRAIVTHEMFARYGYGVLTWDFRAHGASGGELSTMGYNESLDVQAALDYALAQPRVQSVGAHGSSMGAVASIYAAAQRPEIMAVVADSAYYNLQAQLDKTLDIAVLRPLVRLFAEWETELDMDLPSPADRIGEISPRPILIIQGNADSIIPVESAERLYKAAGEPRFLWVEDGVDHVEMRKIFPEEYEQRVIEFFDQYLLR